MSSIPRIVGQHWSGSGLLFGGFFGPFVGVYFRAAAATEVDPNFSLPPQPTAAVTVCGLSVRVLRQIHSEGRKSCRRQCPLRAPYLFLYLLPEPLSFPVWNLEESGMTAVNNVDFKSDNLIIRTAPLTKAAD